MRHGEGGSVNKDQFLRAREREKCKKIKKEGREILVELKEESKRIKYENEFKK